MEKYNNEDLILDIEGDLNDYNYSNEEIELMDDFLNFINLTREEQQKIINSYFN